MSDDALAKAAYDAHAAACGMQGVLDWDELTPHQQVAWRAAARAVLEAAGYEEAIALVEELRQWVYSDCASIVLYGPEDCQHCAYRKACKLPGLAERIQAALARAGKEA